MTAQRIFTLLTAGALAMTAAASHAAEKENSKAQKYRVYFGTYSSGGSEGIYMADFDATQGRLSEPKLAAKVKDPSFLALHPSQPWLYAVSEISDMDGKKTGGVLAFKIEEGGKLTQLNYQSSEGAGPCHLSVDPSGKSVLVANYGAGSIASLPIEEGGKLGKAGSAIQHKGSSVNKGRQEAPHAHSINVDAKGRFAVVADLGLDKVLVYKLDAAKAKLEANDPPAAASKGGAGPRHFAFHPSGKFAYVCNELDSTVTAYQWDADKGTLTELHTLSTLPEGGHKGNSTAEVQVHPSGKFVYVSNRGHNSLAMYAVGDDGKLKALGQESSGGKIPRNFGVDPTGKWVLAANQDSGNVAVLKVDQATGKLTPTDHEIKVARPVCVKFLALE